MKCPLQFYFERVLKLPRRTISDAQVLGSSIHSALEYYHQKLLAGKPVQAQDIHATFLSAWDNQTQHAEVIQVNDKSPEDSKAKGIALLELYLNEPPPEQIVAIEQPIMVPVTTSDGTVLEKPLLVIPDLISRQENRLKVHEIKTSGRAYSDSEVASSLQPTCYGHAVNELTGEEPMIEFTVLVKTKTPKVQRIEAARNLADFGRLGDIIQTVSRAVSAGIFYPVESPMNCSSCAFYRPCREWSGPAGVADIDLADRIRKETVPC